VDQRGRAAKNAGDDTVETTCELGGKTERREAAETGFPWGTIGGKLALTDQQIMEVIDERLRKMDVTLKLREMELTQRKMREAQVLALKEELETTMNNLSASMERLGERLDSFLNLGKEIKDLERRVAILTLGPPQSFGEAMERAGRGHPAPVKHRDADTREYR
jgi:hypothetical protein